MGKLSVSLCGIELDNPVIPASGTFGFFPYNMQLGDAVLETALATPFCKLDVNGAETFVFYGDYEPQYIWKNGKAADVLHLTREQALNAYKVTLDQDYLVVNDNYVWEEDGKLVVVGDATTTIMTYPELTEIPQGFAKKGSEGRLTVYERVLESHPATVSFRKISEEGDTATFEIDVNYLEKGNRLAGRDTFIWLDYAGYSMELFVGEEKINDHYYTGQLVPVSMGYFNYPEKLTMKIKALKEDDWVYIEEWPKLTDGRTCSLNAVTVTEEYR